MIVLFAKSGDVILTTPHLESSSLIKIYRDDLREYLGKHDLSELKIYDIDSILIATNSFSITNKLGQGGFGPVYKVLCSARIAYIFIVLR